MKIGIKEENIERIKDIIMRIKPIKAEIEDIGWGEQAIFDELPDNVQESEKGKELFEMIGNIIFAFGSCETVEQYLYEVLGVPFGHDFDKDKRSS